MRRLPTNRMEWIAETRCSVEAILTLVKYKLYVREPPGRGLLVLSRRKLADSAGPFLPPQEPELDITIPLGIPPLTPMKPVIPFVQLYAFVMPTTDSSELHVGGPCDERFAIRYQVWGWHPGEQTWIRTLRDGHQLDEAEQAAREWHEMIAGKLGSPNLVEVPSNETLFAWANDLRRLRRMEFPE